MKRFVLIGVLLYIVLMAAGLCACDPDGEGNSYDYSKTTAPTATSTTYYDPDGPGWTPGFH